jgi:hypothetical protein
MNSCICLIDDKMFSDANGNLNDLVNMNVIMNPIFEEFPCLTRPRVIELSRFVYEEFI